MIPTNTTKKTPPKKTFLSIASLSLLIAVVIVCGLSAHTVSAATITGSGFSPSGNSVLLTNLASPTETTEIDGLSSPDGTTLSFIIPTSTPGGAYDLQVGAFNAPWSSPVPVNISDIVSFTASPTTVNAGQSTTFSWIANATVCRDIPARGGAKTFPGTYSIMDTPLATTIYTLTCSLNNPPNDYGGTPVTTSSSTVTVIVNPLVTVSATGSGTIGRQTASGVVPLTTVSSSTASFIATYGSSATLVASPSAGSSFTGWSGVACNGGQTSSTCTFTATTSVAVGATFATSFSISSISIPLPQNNIMGFLSPLQVVANNTGSATTTSVSVSTGNGWSSKSSQTLSAGLTILSLSVGLPTPAVPGQATPLTVTVGNTSTTTLLSSVEVTQAGTPGVVNWVPPPALFTQAAGALNWPNGISQPFMTNSTVKLAAQMIAGSEYVQWAGTTCQEGTQASTTCTFVVASSSNPLIKATFSTLTLYSVTPVSVAAGSTHNMTFGGSAFATAPAANSNITIAFTNTQTSKVYYPSLSYNNYGGSSTLMSINIDFCGGCGIGGNGIVPGKYNVTIINGDGVVSNSVPFTVTANTPSAPDAAKATPSPSPSPSVTSSPSLATTSPTVIITSTGTGIVGENAPSSLQPSLSSLSFPATPDSTVTVNEQPGAGFTFGGWSGTTCNEGQLASTCTFTMGTANMYVSAAFNRISSGGGGGPSYSPPSPSPSTSPSPSSSPLPSAAPLPSAIASPSPSDSSVSIRQPGQSGGTADVLYSVGDFLDTLFGKLFWGK